MKKFILGLTALLMFSFAGVANEGDDNNYSSELMAVVNSQMVTLVGAMDDSYTQGVTFENWTQNATSYAPSSSEVAVLQVVFNYLQSGATPQQIMQGDNSSLISLAQNGVGSGDPDGNQPAGAIDWKKWAKAVAYAILIVIGFI